MNATLAILPIFLVFLLMIALRWSGPKAGLAGWCCGLVVGLFAFGLNWQVFWVSQGKGLLLTLNVLLVLWPAIFLYNIVDQVGAIHSIALALQGMVHDKEWLLILQAWMLSAVIESLAGCGLPIAMIAPLLMELGVPPVLAVVTTAIGHTWAGTTGGMALSFRILSDITQYSPSTLFPQTAILLGISILCTGLATAFFLKQKRQWWRVLITGSVAAITQYWLGTHGLITVCGLLASVAGFATGIGLSREPHSPFSRRHDHRALWAGLIAYGILVAIMLLVALDHPLNLALSVYTWTLSFPTAVSSSGITTPAENGYLFHLLTHPGTLILMTIVLTLLLFRVIPAFPDLDLRQAFRASVRSSLSASLGSLFMINLSTLMEHTGMIMVLAQSLSSLVGSYYPLLSPVIGVLGSFTTGSNLNSNTIFGLLQKEVALLIGKNPIIFLAAQTTGGSLGSMIAPAKLSVGTSTSGVMGHEGEVLRYTLPVCLVIALLIGVFIFFLAT